MWHLSHAASSGGEKSNPFIIKAASSVAGTAPPPFAEPLWHLSDLWVLMHVKWKQLTSCFVWDQRSAFMKCGSWVSCLYHLPANTRGNLCCLWGAIWQICKVFVYHILYLYHFIGPQLSHRRGWVPKISACPSWGRWSLPVSLFFPACSSSFSLFLLSSATSWSNVTFQARKFSMVTTVPWNATWWEQPQF